MAVYQMIDGVITELSAEEHTVRIAERDRAEAVKIVSAYKILRESNYPSVRDQLDMIFHDGLDEWRKTIQAVKDKYPKPDR
jgi:hypothetical protein